MVQASKRFSFSHRCSWKISFPYRRGCSSGFLLFEMFPQPNFTFARIIFLHDRGRSIGTVNQSSQKIVRPGKNSCSNGTVFKHLVIHAKTARHLNHEASLIQKGFGGSHFVTVTPRTRREFFALLLGPRANSMVWWRKRTQQSAINSITSATLTVKTKNFLFPITVSTPIDTPRDKKRRQFLPCHACRAWLIVNT